MPRNELSKKSKYYLPKNEYSMVKSFCRRYPEWEAELDVLPDAARAITYDGDRVQTSRDSDPVSDLALRRIGLEKKKDIIDRAVAKVAPEIAEYIIRGICYGETERQLKWEKMPCGKNYYYEKCREARWEIARRIDDRISL